MVNESNEFAYKVLKEISNINSKVELPLYLFGDHCAGKTHLMQALGNALQSQGKNVIYTSIEKITRDFLYHLSNRTMDKFKAKYYDCDYLLVEGLSSLSTKYATQEEIVEMIHWFEIENKCIVLSAEVAPQNLEGFGDTLLNKFDKCLILELSAPSDELKKKIIKQKLSQYNLDYDQNWIEVMIDQKHDLCKITAEITLLVFKAKFTL